ncbi:hypothetical protein Uis1B_1397 [Bifidobacterium margollesii]|uniref:DUF2316 family protein n=1 Tax=Bifidobacterium margollesii TaxID=2020964 RepID=A0A2N5J9D7_9BIFI|nr:DUF2316 family protein [Bifidobacterium margollesii]PLS30815.1 hypothetical protein Uis1B_1397 [Bifidobacterium margollesii]
MSLSLGQRIATKREFRENMRRLGLDADDIGRAFGVDGSTIETIIDLKSGVLEYPWIVRGYLIDVARERGVELTPFTALKGDPHDYWFLDGAVIDANVLHD